MKYLLEIKNIFEGKKIRSVAFEEVDTFYTFTTENISGYLPNVKNMDILTVAASGDHYFNLILNGASSIDLFDINYLSKFIMQLKKTATENLDYEYYLIFFGLCDINHIFDYTIYLKFCKYLDEETYEFWNYLYKLANYDGYIIYQSDLVFKHEKNQKNIFKMNSYLTEENYSKLKRILPNKKINFIHCDINDLMTKIIQKYDMMFFSNINYYQKDTKYIKVVKKLSKFLKENGSIYFSYIYGYPNNLSFFFDQLLKKETYTSEIIDGVDELSSKDKVYIYKK